MSYDTPINTKKRPCPSRESSKSFMKSIASTVSHIISPVVNWFSPLNSSKENGSTQKADETDSSSEEVTSPPAKKICYNFTEFSNHIGPSGVFHSTSNIGSTEPAAKKLKRELNHISTLNHSITNELHEEKNEHDYGNIPLDTEKIFPTTSRQSVIKKRQKKTLFSKKDEKSCELPRNKKLADSIIHSNQPMKTISSNSTFYPGKTTYGGASAFNMNQVNVKVCVKTGFDRNSSFYDNCMSQSAKRMMNALGNYSSPLTEGRRIPQFTDSSKKDVLKTNMENNKRRTYKTQELHVPNYASILFIEKKNKNSSSSDTRNIVKQINASHSSTLGYQAYLQNKPKRVFSKKVMDNYIPNITNAEMDLTTNFNTPVELPPAEIDKSNLPNLNNCIPEVSEVLTIPVTITADKPMANSLSVSSDDNINGDSEQNVRKNLVSGPKHIANEYVYKFSKPIILSMDTLNSNPQKNKENTEVIEQQGISAPIIQPLQTDSDIEKKKLKDWKCSDCWVNNKANVSNCICCSAKKPTEENKSSLKCSMCKYETNLVIGSKLCFKCETVQKNCVDNKLPLPTSTESSDWMCNDCWVKNDASAEKCICCGSEKPGVKDNDKQIHDQKCADNYDNENSYFNTYSASSAAEPVTLSAFVNEQNLSTTKKQDNTYKNIFKKQSNMWECSCCLVNNDINTSKCICCDAGKPKPNNNNFKKFNFSGACPKTFKFGIDHNTECDSDKKIETEKMSINEEWETNNVSATPCFKFGLPTKETEDKKEKNIANNLSVAPEVPKLNFKFGISKPATIDQPNNSNLLKCDNNQQQVFVLTSTGNLPGVGKLDMGIPVAQNVLNADNVSKDNTFKTHLSSSASMEKQLIPIPADIENCNILTESKNTSFTPLNINTSREVNMPNTLNFCVPGVTIAANLFNAPSVIETSAVTSVNSLIASPVVNTIPLPGKSDKNIVTESPLFRNTDSVTMFQIPETTKAADDIPLLTAPPIFNFGHSNKQSPISIPETAKFNFSFGNMNKTETPQIFNAAFGVTTNSNSLLNCSQFTFPTDNMVQTNPLLPGSSLGINNINRGNSISNPLGTTENSMCVEKPVKLPSYLPTSATLFGESLQKDNVWTNTNNNSTTMFVTDTNTNSIHRSPFSFGNSTPSDANNSGSVFGNNNANVFSIQDQNPNLLSMFKNSNPNTTNTSSIFGNSQSINTSAPVESIFNNANMSMAGNFSIPSPTMPTFEAPLQNPTQSFIFGSSQQTSGGVFGFGQQQQQPEQPFRNPVYNFGCNQGIPQFTMGSSHNISARRVRKAVRRSTQR